MNKKIFFLTLIMLFLLPCIFSCSKREKLTSNSMWVSIEPKASVELSQGETKMLTAIVRNAKGDIIEPKSVNWSVVPSDLGEFDNPKAVSTVFIAMASGEGEIVLTCEGIQSSVNLTVNN